MYQYGRSLKVKLDTYLAYKEMKRNNNNNL